MSTRLIIAIISHLHVVDRVGNEVAQQLVIQFGCELERPIIDFEAIFQTSDEMKGPLTLDLVVEQGIGHAIDRRRIAQFFIERSLIVQAGSETETEILIE